MSEQSECTCPYTDPSTWLSAASCGYGSGYEPGSMQEWDPDCPVHPMTAPTPDANDPSAQEGLAGHIAVAGLPWPLEPEEGGVTEIEGRGQVIATADDLDAAFIVAAVNALPELLARAESATAALAALVAGIEGLAATWEADDEESLNTFGQHLMGGAVRVCAEQLRARLTDSTGDPR